MDIERKEQHVSKHSLHLRKEVERNLEENERERESKSMTKQIGQTDSLPMLIQVHPLEPRYP